MTTIDCPRCAGQVWVRDVLAAAPGSAGALRLTRAAAPGPLRWTCTGCGHQAPHGGILEWRLDGAPMAHRAPRAAGSGAR